MVYAPPECLARQAPDPRSSHVSIVRPVARLGPAATELTMRTLARPHGRYPAAWALSMVVPEGQPGSCL